jgi:hypothetical protein
LRTLDSIPIDPRRVCQSHHACEAINDYNCELKGHIIISTSVAPMGRSNEMSGVEIPARPLRFVLNETSST